MANTAIKFYKQSTAPSAAAGSIWFDTTSKTIKTYSGTAWEQFGGVVNATLANNVLTITKADASTITLNFSDVASAKETMAVFETLNTAIGTKVDKVEGKGLSTEDYTTEEKTKLAGIEEGAQVNVIEEVQVNGTALTVTDKKVNVVIPAAAEYSIAKDANSGDYAAVYHLTKDGVNVGSAINIAKDKFLKNVELISTAESGVSVEVPYLKFTFENVETPVRVSMKSFLDDTNIVTSVAAKTGETLIAVDPTTGDVKISATEALTSAVAKANSAVQAIATGSANGTISVDGTDIAVKGLGSAAYTDADAYATAAQGALADSAVQSVAKGTDGDYFTTTIGGSDTARTVAGAVTVQAVSTASATARGLAEASDVKDYVDSALSWTVFN